MMLARKSLLNFGMRCFASNLKIKLHDCDAYKLDKSILPKTSEATKEECLQYYRDMNLVRRVEIACDNCYKNKEMRGFCHLYDGQEAVCVGIEAAITRNDHIITAYRCHGQQICRGDTPERILAEMMGKVDGCSKGKGGSMHITLAKNKFYGGNGIVGGQTPLGTGIAFGIKYENKKEVSVTMYGDGAANQGQLYEAANMAKLWSLPVIYVCENNLYAMGTANARATANTNYHTKLDLIPGIKGDGQNIFAVKEIMKFARKWCLDGKGPICIEYLTYIYHGHSMSDPGLSYRSREEVADVRKNRDPIDIMKKILMENNICKENELKEIEQATKKQVDDAVEIARASKFPVPDDLYRDVVTGPYTIRGVILEKQYVQN